MPQPDRTVKPATDSPLPIRPAKARAPLPTIPAVTTEDRIADADWQEFVTVQATLAETQQQTQRLVQQATKLQGVTEYLAAKFRTRYHLSPEDQINNGGAILRAPSRPEGTRPAPAAGDPPAVTEPVVGPMGDGTAE